MTGFRFIEHVTYQHNPGPLLLHLPAQLPSPNQRQALNDYACNFRAKRPNFMDSLDLFEYLMWPKDTSVYLPPCNPESYHAMDQWPTTERSGYSNTLQWTSMPDKSFPNCRTPPDWWRGSVMFHPLTTAAVQIYACSDLPIRNEIVHSLISQSQIGQSDQSGACIIPKQLSSLTV